MGKKNSLMMPEEREQHDFAVKLRKMTDKQLYNYVNSLQGKGPTPSEVVQNFISACAENGRRMGPATICCMKTVAKEAGYDIGV